MLPQIRKCLPLREMAERGCKAPPKAGVGEQVRDRDGDSNQRRRPRPGPGQIPRPVAASGTAKAPDRISASTPRP